MPPISFYGLTPRQWQRRPRVGLRLSRGMMYLGVPSMPSWGRNLAHALQEIF